MQRQPGGTPNQSDRQQPQPSAAPQRVVAAPRHLSEAAPTAGPRSAGTATADGLNVII
jgi:hypothetical protein